MVNHRARGIRTECLIDGPRERICGLCVQLLVVDLLVIGLFVVSFGNDLCRPLVARPLSAFLSISPEFTRSAFNFSRSPRKGIAVLSLDMPQLPAFVHCTPAAHNVEVHLSHDPWHSHSGPSISEKLWRARSPQQFRNWAHFRTGLTSQIQRHYIKISKHFEPI